VNGERGLPREGGFLSRSLVRKAPFTVYRLPFTLFLLTACGGLSPFRGRAVVGRDAYLVFVADGSGGQSDLFAVRGDGGPVFPLTYSSVPESAPAVSPDGGAVAFLRGHAAADPHPGVVWVLNLLSGAERQLDLPRQSSPADRVGWSRDGRFLYVRAGRVTYRLSVPPAAAAPQPVTGPEWFRAESSFAVLLGDPPFGRIVPCGVELCVQGPGGEPAPLAPGAHDAARWGTDSVGYLVGADLVVRPVGPGRARVVEWSEVPGRPRELTYFAGGSVNGER
jgi:hypothetical protein